MMPSLIASASLPRWRLALYGLIIVLLMIFRPNGILPATPTRSRGYRGATVARDDMGAISPPPNPKPVDAKGA